MKFKCRHCGHVYEGELNFCPSCGKRQHFEYYRCPECSEVFQGRPEKCPRCGHQNRWKVHEGDFPKVRPLEREAERNVHWDIGGKVHPQPEVVDDRYKGEYKKAYHLLRKYNPDEMNLTEHLIGKPGHGLRVAMVILGILSLIFTIGFAALAILTFVQPDMIKVIRDLIPVEDMIWNILVIGLAVFFLILTIIFFCVYGASKRKLYVHFHKHIPEPEAAILKGGKESIDTGYYWERKFTQWQRNKEVH